ncbi:class I SAM-dependent methyltransferase [Phototrophicus methaneseepsis]|uniref:Class I SAM-dependent methyltransferase n=1 Tax=Phototrophicus methaneseepsis TaxID=2710758 RepID=A0A7S8E762_9CHLR|nr:class I SAM-dependent methyltransferase [Phototrophicus methaneseepsis]QPC81609.1 class I SAM-dependent methyltransferase [Phototrophicus methaneseepsis]
MTDHFKNIYANKADLYDRMVAREDQHGNLFSALNEIHDLAGATAVDLGAGTGRVTRLLSFQVAQVIGFDMAPAMLAVAREQLELTGMDNWALAVAQNEAIPLANDSVDVVVEGWSFGHAVGWYPDDWRDRIGAMLSEMARVVRPGGTLILLETLGTGRKSPEPPTEGLAELYAWWEGEQGFQHRWIRTDYQFESVAEADELTRFFFGDDLADSLVEKNQVLLPECTGIWWKQV